MSEPFIGEITMFAGNFPPRGWAFCQGQIMSIAQNTALFSLLGTTYGGNGQTTFALPDLRGRAPVHAGQLTGGGNYDQGQFGGAESVSLIATEIPAHSHTLAAGSTGTQASPSGGLPATTPARDFRYSNAAASAALHAGTISSGAGAQPHENRAPVLALNFIIALEGIFPSRN
ncbi:phage tail protein [Acidovorax sp. Root219]|uniref:phage tail protein n=1 Tax=Acidovorax sp. Root219 TaxID=1736493 RepID=UPI00070E2F01|nr:tail fiber protein [Acidovorax sp. Root219]KRC28726.1 phage tail protein [Acidovorax sp. Root219]